MWVRALYAALTIVSALLFVAALQATLWMYALTCFLLTTLSYLGWRDHR